MRINSSSEYAMRVMYQLARSDGSSPVTAERLAQLENIPRDYVDQILLRLRRAGLIQSRRGTAGGYVLAAPAGKISAANVMRAVDGRIFEDICQSYSSGETMCRHTGGCSIRPVWLRLAYLVEGYLEKVTLDQLLDESRIVKLVKMT